MRLSWKHDDPYLFNSAHNPSLISYDKNYCTTVVDIDGETQVPTVNYIFEQVIPFFESPSVVDIGCGQGELVELLRNKNIEAEGYDPILRSEAPHLHRRYWSPSEPSADLFIMRCVLPHIPEPWTFLDGIADVAPSAMVLIEFQRIEWIIEQGIWYQLSHDHVNLFSIDDFQARYEVPAWGTFAHGEWGWVLILPISKRAVEPIECRYIDGISNLMAERSDFLRSFTGRRTSVWGAAGKGGVLVHALTSAGAEIPYAIDADPNRWGLFLEVSGTAVVSPQEALRSDPGLNCLVANPNHMAEIAQQYGNSLNLNLVRP